MVDNNKIYEDLNASDGDDIQKNENLLFKELLEFEKLNKRDLPLLVNNYIEFILVEQQIGYSFEPSIKLAADSSVSADEKVSKKSEFLLSRDGKYALKYIQKSKEEIFITLLTDNNLDTREMLLYLPDLKKYFVSNSTGDFTVAGYSSLNIGSLNFNAVVCFEKIIISKAGDLFSMVSYNNYASPEIIEKSDIFIKVKVNSIKECSVAVLINELNKDFVNSVNGILEIPVMLLRDKTVVLLY